MAIRRQHVISQTILKRWTVDGVLAAIDLRNGRVSSKSTRATGFVPWFVQADYSESIERMWRETEDRIPDLIAAVEAGTAFDSDNAIDGLRQIVAVHVVRSKQMAEMWARSYTQQTATGRIANIRGALTDPGVRRALYERETGIAVIGEVPAALVADPYIERIERISGPGGLWFVDNALASHAKLVNTLRSQSVQIGHHVAGGLIIGDNPATTYDPGRELISILGGANLTQSIIVMPITPNYMISFGKTSGYIELSDAHAQLFNNIQYVSSMDWIYTVPRSPDLPLIAAAVRADPNLQRQ